LLVLWHRYLLVLWLAKSTQFRPLGKETDDTVYFNLYDLCKVADSLRESSPHHFAAIQYDSKVAIKIYNMLTNNGLVSIIKLMVLPT
jgi:hypothetical protein